VWNQRDEGGELVGDVGGRQGMDEQRVPVDRGDEERDKRGRKVWG